MDLIIPFLFFGIGVYCLVSRRNLFKIMMGIVCMFKASDILFIASAFEKGDVAGKAMAVLSISIEASFLAIMIIYVVKLKDVFNIKDISKLKRLKG